MILKYENKNVWGFIDNVRQAASKNIDIDEAARRYDIEMPHEPQDSAEYMNGVKLSEEIIKSNKAFLIACSDMADEGVNRHSENLVDENIISMPVTAILLYLEDCKEYDAVLLVTNQRAYLMNDKGQTIERLS